MTDNRSAYDRSPCSPLLTDSDKERIYLKACRSTLPMQFRLAMAEEQEREPIHRNRLTKE